MIATKFGGVKKNINKNTRLASLCGLNYDAKTTQLIETIVIAVSGANLPLILASSSPFRRELLERLGLPFETFGPEVDETPLESETAEDLVGRLAIAKAKAASTVFAAGLVIGSDQVCVNDGRILGKPGDHDSAMAQLRQASGKSIYFYTGLCLYNIQTEQYQVHVEPFEVHFRHLSEAQIDQYLRTEQPYQCAGSFKSEGLGIALFDQLSGDDPNALIGLPMIQLVRMLSQEGVDVLG